MSLEPKKRNTTNKIKYKEVKYLKKKCVCLSEIKKIRPLNSTDLWSLRNYREFKGEKKTGNLRGKKNGNLRKKNREFKKKNGNLRGKKQREFKKKTGNLKKKNKEKNKP